jgi:hypothetical protein
MDLELEIYYYYNRMTDRNIASSSACHYKTLILLSKIIKQAILSVPTRSRLPFTLPTSDVVKIKIYNRRKTALYIHTIIHIIYHYVFRRNKAVLA